MNFRSLANAVRTSVRVLQKIRSGAAATCRTQRAPAQARQAPPVDRPGPHGAIPATFSGAAAIRYAPQPDGSPDPGEIVWTWVPYEEDHTGARTVRCCWSARTAGTCWA